MPNLPTRTRSPKALRTSEVLEDGGRGQGGQLREADFQRARLRTAPRSRSRALRGSACAPIAIPTATYPELRQAVADANPGAETTNVLVGNGSSEVLLNVLQLLPRGEVVYGWPSFSLYPTMCAVLGMSAREVPLAEGHEITPEALLSAVTRETRAVILCNPNNPTGTFMSPGQVQELAEELPDDVLLIVDEAYREFVEDPAYEDSHTLALRKGERVGCPHVLEGARPGGPQGRLRHRLQLYRGLCGAGAVPGLSQPGGPGRGHGFPARDGQSQGARPVRDPGAQTTSGGFPGCWPRVHTLAGQLRDGPVCGRRLREIWGSGARGCGAGLSGLEPGDGWRLGRERPGLSGPSGKHEPHARDRGGRPDRGLCRPRRRRPGWDVVGVDRPDVLEKATQTAPSIAPPRSRKYAGPTSWCSPRPYPR